MSGSSEGAEKMPAVKSPIAYRAHIDGLRGIAIIAVILYHAKLLGVTGGFIGVDIFFVISGFLITSIILRDLDLGRFSLAAFWERRVRRIVPALFVMMLAASVAAYFLILYPPDYHHFGNTMIAQSVFASNVLFMTTDNYFDQSSRYSPLLHTWTLSVEEQFYVIFPCLVLLCLSLAGRKRRSTASASGGADTKAKWAGRRLLLAGTLILGAASFITSMILVNIYPASALHVPFIRSSVFWATPFATAGFYLLPSRAWELGLGIVLALVGFKIRSKVMAEASSILGLIAIVASIFVFNDGTPFPGIAALVPTLGAALIIVSDDEHRTITGTMLSSPILVWIGLLSYSLYLWHWPIFVFAALASPVPLSSINMAGLIIITGVIAWLSYKFIETPVRKKQIFPKRRDAFLLGLAALLLLALIGFLITRTSLTSDARIPPAAEKVLLAAGAPDDESGNCFQLPGDAASYGGICRIGDTGASTSPQFVLWGDSHADAISPLLDAMGKQYGVQGVVFDGGSCIPVIGADESPPANGCAQERTEALQYINDHDIKKVILAARWNYYVMGGPDALRVAYITDSKQISTSPQEAQGAFERTLVPMVNQMTAQGRHVYIVEQAPEQFNFDTRAAFYKAVWTGEDAATQGISSAQNDAYQARSISVIESLATTTGVVVIDPSSILCETGGSCALESGGKVLYRDENHLSTAGAMLLEPLFTKLFENMKSGY